MTRGKPTPPKLLQAVLSGVAEKVPRRQIAEQLSLSLGQVHGLTYRHQPPPREEPRMPLVPAIRDDSTLPAKPTLPAPFALLLDAAATVPTERKGNLLFLVIGQPRQAYQIGSDERRIAFFLLQDEPFYRPTPLDLIRAGLRQLAMSTSNGDKYAPRLDEISPLYFRQLRIVPQWLLRRAASRHLLECRWFPAIADLAAQASCINQRTVSEATRLWMIAESLPSHCR